VPFTAGNHVTVRGERWVVDEATVFADTTLLTLSSPAQASALQRCRLLAPFDRPVLTSRSCRIRGVTRRRWMHHLHAELSSIRGFDELRSPQRAGIDIFPFQLAPALALIRGRASRFLLADEVGLGKTIQAGLMLSELRVRGWCERALIVTPAGLRQQWARELWQRFDIHATIMDASVLAARADSLPFDVNPWSVEPVAITSIDFLKQPEVLHGVVPQSWDVLIVDEAHQATVASQRYDAINAVATRARHVLLLTATPHAGDSRAYRALCGIGQLDKDDPILLFRRTRSVTGRRRTRRVHLLPVRLTAADIEMHRLLEGYLGRLWTIARLSGSFDAQLIAMVLAKRAFSSAHSLATSLERRFAALEGRTDVPAQLALPIDLDDDRSDEPALPAAAAFEHVDEERALLRRIIDAASHALDGEPKMRVLARIVRRVREPLIVFTEYRDTLDAIRAAIGAHRTVTTLHGGQTPQERRQSVDDFTSGTADVMIATDAGSEGLNLQSNCRLVVNLELPWNPVRLEQRIGRVDRIGQRRTVHAINLLADGTAERTVLANLLRRLDRIRVSEIDIASCVINRTEAPPRVVREESVADVIDLAGDARAEAHRLAQARRFGAARSYVRPDTVPITVVRSTESSFVSFFRIRLVTGSGRLVEESLLPLHLPIERPSVRLTRSAARALAESLSRDFGPLLTHSAIDHAHQRAVAIASEGQRTLARSVRRERAVAQRLAPSIGLVQPGLFDTRALKLQQAADERQGLLAGDSDARIHLLEADSTVRLAHDPELVMLLIQCSRV
jgi:superfamily II DNA or RNA helicase